MASSKRGGFNMEVKPLIPLPNDLTDQLESVSFEMAFKDASVTHIQVLRSRCHLINLSICVYTFYFVSTLDTAKKAVNLRASSQRSQGKMTMEMEREARGLRISMIGCGKLGSQIARCLLLSDNVHPRNLLISTRRPELLGAFSKKGVSCINNNIEACMFADALLLCISPAQLPLVAKQINGYIRPQCIVYSIIAGQPIKKLSSLLGTTNIFCTELSWNEESLGKGHWDSKGDITAALNNVEVIEKILPLGNTEDVVQIHEMFPEAMIYAVMNLCIAMSSLSPVEILALVQDVLFGEAPETGVNDKDRLLSEDIDPELKDRTLFSCVEIGKEKTALNAKLQNSPTLRQNFRKKFRQRCWHPKRNEEILQWNWIRNNLNIK